MPIAKAVAARQAKKLVGSLPYFGDDREALLEALSETLAEYCETDAEAAAVAKAILTDESRASSRETNRAPQPAELLQWILAIRRERDGDTEAPRHQACGKLVPGWKDSRGAPARCIDGWISIRQWRSAKPKCFNADGVEIPVPYDFTGRCSCAGGSL